MKSFSNNDLLPRHLRERGPEGEGIGIHTFATLLVLSLLLLSACDAPTLPSPNLAPALAKATQCVAPTAEIRSHHGHYLNQHRDDTVLQGIRTHQYSLNACIQCHIDATRADGSTVRYGDTDHFCSSCHQSASVKIDCFQCHADHIQAQQRHYQHALSANAHSKQLAHGQKNALSLREVHYLLPGTAKQF